MPESVLRHRGRARLGLAALAASIGALVSSSVYPDLVAATKPSPAHLSSVAPAHGPAGGGNPVVITGENLGIVTEVRFGGTPAESFTRQSSTSITAVAPSGASGTTVNVSLGPAFIPPSAESTVDDYTYDGETRRAVTAMPDRGPEGGGTPVTLTGDGIDFQRVTLVDFGGIEARIVGRSSTSVDVIAPFGAASTQAFIRVTRDDGHVDGLPGNVFAYEADAQQPIITRLTPATVSASGGERVVVEGTGLSALAAVLVGGAPVPANLSGSYPATVEFEVPARAPGKVDVSIVTSYGTTTNTAADDLTFVAPTPAPPLPAITGLSPRTGLAGFGGLTTISGTDLRNVKTVRFGAKSAAFVLSGGKILAWAPPQARGTVPVTVTTKDGTSEPAAVATYTYKSLF